MDSAARLRQAELEAENAALRARITALEAHLARAERMADALLEHVPLAAQIYDASGNSLRMNERHRDLLGLPDVDSGVGRFNVLNDPFVEASGLTEAFRRAYAGEVVCLPTQRVDLGIAENHWPTSKGSIWFRQTLAPVIAPEGEIEAVIAFVEDVTNEYEALDSLARTMEIWEAFFTHAPIAIQIFDQNGTSLRMNEANRRLLGLPDVTYGIGMFNALTDPFMVAQGHATAYAQAYAGQLVELPDTSADFGDPANLWPTGRHIAHYTQILVPIKNPDGNVVAVVSCAVDITTRKQAEQVIQRLNADLEAQVAERTAALRDSVAHLEQEVTERRQVEASLRASEERYRALVESSPNLLFRLTRDGHFLDVHAPRLDQLYVPPEQFLGQQMAAVMPPELTALFLEGIGRALDSGEVQVIEYCLPIGSAERWFEARIIRSGEDEVFASVHDSTMRRQAEDRRLQVERRIQEAQRLEGLAVLAGGIAHDFNNILTTILGRAELALTEPGSPDTYAHLAAISTSTRRAADLTAQILAYAGRGRVQSQAVSLSELINDLRALIAAIVDTQGEIRYQLADGLVPIIGDGGQLRQLVLNLVTNAVEAFEPAWGVISLETASEELSRARLDQLILGANASPGPYVRLTVHDSGAGMDSATLARIFDPFFTTKFAGRGLGLAAVHGVVRGHHGVMEVRSVPGQGTIFHVWLPAAQLAESLPQPHRPAAAPTIAHVVLVVDDEEGIRLVVRRMLERDGYRVVVALDGADAIALLEAGIPGLAGVLLDLTMPGVASETVSAAVRATHPDVPIILMSGYSRQELAERQQALGAAGWLQKPFSGSALRAAVTQIFGRPGLDR